MSSLKRLIPVKPSLSLIILLVLGLVVVGAFVYRYRSSGPAIEFAMDCPVPQEFCDSVREIMDEGSFGFSLPKGTEIRSPISGYLSIGTLKASGNAHFVWVAPTPKDKSAFSVGLIFNGNISDFRQGSVVGGQLLGNVEGSLEGYGGADLVVQVYKGEAKVSNSLLYLRVAR